MRKLIILLSILIPFFLLYGKYNSVILSDFEIWTSINEKKYVTYENKNWKGEDDLSFKYKISLKNDVLNLNIIVKDNNTILKDVDTIISDHVELWLFDPRLLNEIENDKKQLNNFITQRKKMFLVLKKVENDKEKKRNQDENRVNKFIIDNANQQLKKYNKLKYFTQFIFNNKQLSTYPKLKFNNDIQYSYKINSKGYEFTLVMSLFEKFSIKKGDMNELGILISISDIDNSKAKKQEKLMSSSSIAKFRKPSTFNILKLKNQINFKLPSSLTILNTINSNGLYYYSISGFQYFIRREEPFSGNFGADRGIIPGGYIKFELNEFFRSNNITFYSYNKKLILKNSKSFKMIDLSKYIHSKGAFVYSLIKSINKNGKNYLLINVNGASRWPQGATYCGAGLEEDIILLIIDKNLSKIDITGVLIHSCLQSIESEFEKDERGIMIYYNNFLKKSKGKIEFDFINPESKFIVKEKLNK